MAEAGNTRILDFIHERRKIELPTGDYLLGEEAVRASQLSQKLKNVIMQFILKNRETRKVPKLKDILNEAIERQNREQAAKRRDKIQ